MSGLKKQQVTDNPTYPSLFMVKFRSHGFHYLTEAFQIFTHILEVDFFLLVQKL